MRFLLFSLTAAFSLFDRGTAPLYQKSKFFLLPKKSHYFSSFKYLPFFTHLKSNNISHWSQFYALDQMFIYEKSNLKNQPLKQHGKDHAQNLNFEQQEQNICTAIENIFDINNTSTVPNVIQTIQHNENVYEKCPELKKIFNEQQQNPNMKKFHEQIKAIPNDQLPPQIAKKRNQLEEKIHAMGSFEKAKYIYKLSKKFTK